MTAESTWPAVRETAFVAALADASRTLESIGDDPALSVGALERYARACADAALLRRRWESRGCPTSSAGGNGQVTVHPLVEGIRKAEREAADLGERLGLTPAARRAMGRRVTGGHQVGEGRAPDRAPIRRVA
jgi:Phage terminase, small subunit